MNFAPEDYGLPSGTTWEEYQEILEEQQEQEEYRRNNGDELE